MADALPVATLPIYPGLGQAPNMLACIPSGLVESKQATKIQQNCCKHKLKTVLYIYVQLSNSIVATLIQ